MKKRNHGFTLVEMIVVVSIFAILLGVVAPSLNSILGFRVQRATNSIGAALKKTKTEAMSRLVGEMVLEKKSDGCYITYHLYRGKTSGIVQDDPEKIAPERTKISYSTSPDYDNFMELTNDQKLIFTYNRDDGSFRELQSDVLSSESIKESLDNQSDVVFMDSGVYCTAIKVEGGFRTRIIELNQATGSYIIRAV